MQCSHHCGYNQQGLCTGCHAKGAESTVASGAVEEAPLNIAWPSDVHTAIQMYLQVVADKKKDPEESIYNRGCYARMRFHMERHSGNAHVRLSAEHARALLQEANWEAAVTIAVAWAYGDKIALRYAEDDYKTQLRNNDPLRHKLLTVPFDPVIVNLSPNSVLHSSNTLARPDSIVFTSTQRYPRVSNVIPVPLEIT